VRKKTGRHKGFIGQARCWVVERTFGWLNRERRLSKDYERKEESSEAFSHLGPSRLMLRRLAWLLQFNTLSRVGSPAVSA
jgi:putative transposase